MANSRIKNGIKDTLEQTPPVVGTSPKILLLLGRGPGFSRVGTSFRMCGAPGRGMLDECSAYGVLGNGVEHIFEIEPDDSSDSALN